MIAGKHSELSAAGLDPRVSVTRGALILSSKQGHLTARQFDVGRMLRRLGKVIGQALADGYGGLPAAGDMTWEFGNNLAKLLRYERRLEEFMQDNPVVVHF